MRSALLRVAATVVALSAPLGAQSVALTTPNGRVADEFSAIRGVRELPDGRVLVSDYIDQRVVVADFDKHTLTPMVTKGSGPREARLPTRLIPIAGDSTLLTDLGNNRLLLFDGAGRPVRTIPAEEQGMLDVRGIDASGNWYYAIPAWVEGDKALPNDSVRIVKRNPRGRVVTRVAVVQGERMRSDIRAPALTPRIPTVGYAARDAWVMDGGTIRIVRGGNYRVESWAPGAPPVIGPSYAYPTRAVTSTDKAAYVREFMATSPTSGKGENGGMGFTPAPTQVELDALVRGTEFAAKHPMFDASDVRVAPEGRLWVGRPRTAGTPSSYDIFDRAGRKIGASTLPAGRRVISIGRRSVYAIADDDGIEHLERYALPDIR